MKLSGSIETIEAMEARAQAVVATVPVGVGMPRAVAVNPATNRIYLAHCATWAGGGITVIDGGANTTTAIPGGCPTSLAVNPVTNKVYMPGAVIDGATNSITTLAAGGGMVAVNPVTNKIYEAGGNGNVTVIDGATNSIVTVTDPSANGLTAGAFA